VNILISGEDVKSVNILAFILKQEGYTIECIVDRNQNEVPDSASTVDLMIIDEQEVTSHLIRRVQVIRDASPVALLLLYSQSSEEDLISAYEAGIDASLIKPFSYAMLIVYVFAQLRRVSILPAPSLPALTTSAFSLDPERHTVTLYSSGMLKQLTNLEFRLLHCLITNRGHVLTTETIIEKVWGYTGEGDRSLLKSLVSRVRGKVEPSPREPKLISTIPGVGYIFNAD